MTIGRVYRDLGCEHGIECIVAVIQVIYPVIANGTTPELAKAMFGILPRKRSAFRRLYLSSRALSVCLSTG